MRAGIRHGLVASSICLALTACGWLQDGYDAGNSRSNDFESRLTADTIASVEQHTIPGTFWKFLVVRNLLVAIDSEGISAFDRATCPRSDNGPCTPRWQFPVANAWQTASDGSTVFVATPATGLTALNLDGGVQWRWPQTFSEDSTATGTTMGSLFMSDGEAALTYVTRTNAGTFDTGIARLPLAGCGSDQCTATVTVLTHNQSQPARPLGYINGQAVTAPTPFALHGYDQLTGSDLWQALLPASVGGFAARDGRVAAASTSGGISVWTPGRGVDCPDVPHTCVPTYVGIEGTNVVAASPNYVFAVAPRADGMHLYWHRQATPGCTAASPCSAAAGSDSFGYPEPIGSMVSVAGSLVYVAGEKSLHAYDANAAVGCNGTPRVCSDLWSVTFDDHIGQGATVYEGRIYVNVRGVIHVFSLPGDVS